jgi:hypothetical protein
MTKKSWKIDEKLVKQIEDAEFDAFYGEMNLVTERIIKVLIRFPHRRDLIRAWLLNDADCVESGYYP